MTDLELTELRQMARRPQHYSNYTLAGALHTALDRLDAAEQQVAAATERAEAAERERDELRETLRQAELERDNILRFGVPRAGAPDRF